MWKKPSPDETPEERPPVGAPPRMQPAAPPVRGAARIGSTLTLKGDLQGEEDLVIEGRIEGKIAIKQGSVTVGEKGRVEADIEASNIQVAGVVKGNLTAAERVVLLESGRVEGNITARSVSLENGCHFKGSIDMQTDSPARPAVRTAPVLAAPPRVGV